MTDTSTTSSPAGPATTAGAPAPAPAAPVPTPPPAPAAPAPGATGSDATPNTPTGQQGDPSDPSTWPPAARAEIDRLRREAGDQRINAKKGAATQALRAAAELAGIELPPELLGDGPLTPEALASQVQSVSGERDAARAEAIQATKDRDLVMAAWQAQVHPAKVDYLRFLANQDTTYQNLDPSSAEYGATLTSTIAALVAKDQTLKVTGSTTASGAEAYGGAGDSQAITQEQFDKMPLDQRQELYFSDRDAYNRLTGRV